jgi:uncharacterized protein
MRVGVISDTHGRLRPEIFTHFAGVELIVHAGDIGPPGILDELGALAPVVAVWGNTDGHAIRQLVPEIAARLVGGKRLVVVHGHQHGSPTPGALRAAHADADIIVHGHTHRPLVDDAAAPLVLNPGSAGAPRFGLPASLALLDIDEHGAHARIVEL